MLATRSSRPGSSISWATRNRPCSSSRCWKEKCGSAINFAFYIGAANPREIVIGTADRPPTPEELRRMEQIVDESMRAGAVGMSTALIYPPGRFATTDELIALARVVSKYGGS